MIPNKSIDEHNTVAKVDLVISYFIEFIVCLAFFGATKSQLRAFRLLISSVRIWLLSRDQGHSLVDFPFN